MEYTKEIIETFDRILEKLDQIEKLINERDVPHVYPSPTMPQPYLGSSTVCSKCGMEWKGVMSYSCPSVECPVQVTTTSQTYNSPYDIYSTGAMTSPGDKDYES